MSCVRVRKHTLYSHLVRSECDRKATHDNHTESFGNNSNGTKIKLSKRTEKKIYRYINDQTEQKEVMKWTKKLEKGERNDTANFEKKA